MRGRVGVVLFGWICYSAPALADGSPVVVIPGRPDVPVFVNPYGFDASYTVVEGDFGLDRPAQVNPVIIAGPHVPPPPTYYRNWGTASDPLPASTDPPYPITIAPTVGPWGPWGPWNGGAGRRR